MTTRVAYATISAQRALSELGSAVSASVASKVPTASSYATPLVQKLAAQHNVDLSTVKGSGAGGRIRPVDVLPPGAPQVVAVHDPEALAADQLYDSLFGAASQHVAPDGGDDELYALVCAGLDGVSASSSDGGDDELYRLMFPDEG